MLFALTLPSIIHQTRIPVQLLMMSLAIIEITITTSTRPSSASDPQEQQDTSTTTNQAFRLESSAFVHNGTIPVRHTCDGENLSPKLTWYNPPTSTKSFALIVEDPDAKPHSWVHWLVFNIPDAIHSLPEGVTSTIPGLKSSMLPATQRSLSKNDQSSTTVSAETQDSSQVSSDTPHTHAFTFVTGITSFDRMPIHSKKENPRQPKPRSYGGPCPPLNSAEHHYHFTLYALDSMLKLSSNANKEALLASMQHHIVGQTTLIGLYKRQPSTNRSAIKRT